MRNAILAALVIVTVTVSWRWGSHVAGGSDSYCYVHQAGVWAEALTFSGPLQPIEPLVAEVPWPDAALTFTPVGHAPSPTVPGAIVPVCPSGLSIVMAPLVAAGGPRAAFLVLPFFAALLVLATYAAGARFGIPVGLGAAVLIAASPIFLYQSVQPMSDVPAAALWVTAVACATGTGRRRLVLAGLAASGAILMRPNLLPLGVVIGAFLLARPERTWRQRFEEAVTYASACAPGCAAVALIQWTFFGSPFSSGYGSFDSLFTTATMWPNLTRYASWLWQSHTAFIVLAFAAPLLLPGALSTTMLAMFAVNLLLYLPYLVFEDWSFLRFLLPTIPLLLILLVAVVESALRRAGPVRPARALRSHAALALVVAGLAWLFVAEARQGNAFRLQAMEARFERAGEFVGERLPGNAIVLAAWETGSVRFYGGRKTIDWTALEPAWLERAIADLRTRGYEPFLLFERSEESAFRERFAAASPLGALDWPPAYEVAAQVRIFRPDDRDRFLTGALPPTEYVR